MNSKIYKLATLFFLVTIASIYYSCKKEDTKDDTTPTNTGCKVTVSATHPTTVGGGDGSATATASGGSAPYTYKWSSGGSTTDKASNLKAGTYTVTVTDANSCTSSGSAILKDPGAEDKDASVAEDNATAESEFEEVFNYVDEESSNNSNGLRMAGGDVDTFFVNPTRYACVDTLYVKKTGSLQNTTRTITFVFTETKTCGNGAKRKGKIITTATGALKNAIGSTINVTFENFYVQRPNMTQWIHIEGTKTITIVEFALRARKLNVKVTGAKLTWGDSVNAPRITWQSDRTRSVAIDSVAKLKTTKMWGTASGTTRKGKPYSAEILEANAMTKLSNCKWISSGKLTVTRTDSTTIKSRTLDYGDGTCDDVATVVLASGDTVQIRLR